MWEGGGTNNHIALIQADKNVHKTGMAFKCAVICNKRGIHQINVPPENLFTPKLSSLHKYQIDFKRVPLEPSFSAFHVLLLSIENNASGCGCSVALSINSITT